MTEKRIFWLLLIVFVISLLPLLQISFYNFPCADDFSASDDVRLAWVNSGTLAALIKAAWDNVVFNYLEWSGVYMSVFWTSLQPGIFGENYYFLTNWFTLGLLIFSGFYFTHVLSSKYIKGKKECFGILTLLYLFIVIQCMPDANEGIFWHAGAANYTWAYCFLLLLVGGMFSFYREERKGRKTGKMIFLCILSVFVGGGNYLTALQGILWLFFLTAGLLFMEGKKQGWKQAGKRKGMLLLPFVVTVAAFLASVLAPGNAERMLEASAMSPVKAILLSFYYWPDLVLKEWLGWPVLLLFFLAVPFLYQIGKEVCFDFPYLGAVIFLCFGMSVACLTPNLYAQSDVGGGRTWNIGFFVMVFLGFVQLFYLIGWIRVRFMEEEKAEQKSREKKIWQSYVLGLLIFGTALAGIFVLAEPKTFTASEAAFDLSTGRAFFFQQEWEERLRVYHNPEIRDVVIKRYTDPPELLLFQDNVPFPEDWINLVVAKYYEKNTVRTE